MHLMPKQKAIAAYESLLKAGVLPPKSKVKHNPSEPILINGYLVFGCVNINDAYWANQEVAQLLPFYPNGFPRLVLNRTKFRQLIVKPAPPNHESRTTPDLL